MDFIYRVDGIELGKIRVYYFCIFPSRDSGYFEIFDLETQRKTRSQSEKGIILNQSEKGIIFNQSEKSRDRIRDDPMTLGIIQN